MYKHLEKLINNYDKRKGKLIEKEVFKTLNAYELDENERAFSYKTVESFKRNFKIKELFRSLDRKVIESNIYLKCCEEYLKSSVNDCTNIMLDVVLDDKYINSENSFSIESITTKNYLFKNDDLNKEELKKISDNLDKMYCEIYRLQLSNMSSIIPHNGIDAYNCTLRREDNNAILTANFLNINHINNSNKTFKLN